MKVLIIGGTGLISTPLTHFLLERGDDVTLYNRGETPVRVPERTRMLHGNRQDYAAFENQMHEAGHFDCVIDMVGYDPGDGESVIRAFKGRVGHFIFCSTVDVYKKPATRYPYTEAETYGGLNTYASNKVIIEKELMEAHSSDFPVTIIRPAYTYGESRGVLYPVGSSSGYFDRIRQGKPIIVHGDGSSLWVACHIDDVARAFMNAIGIPRTFGKSYHTTGEEWMTWDMYHQGVAEALGAPPPTFVHIPTDTLVKLVPERAASVADNFQFNNIFDNSAAQNDLGFQYTIPWQNGVKRAVDWLGKNRKPAPVTDAGIDDQIISAWREVEKQVGQFNLK
ncbi:MAG: NAD-dependent epimerase/dehydratase family protein [Anaerolineaceae bacterium]|nr:NAD-dependent epimerase/dehydratase family protein [Anaerolineaceae bacterium]